MRAISLACSSMWKLVAGSPAILSWVPCARRSRSSWITAASRVVDGAGGPQLGPLLSISDRAVLGPTLHHACWVAVPIAFTWLVMGAHLSLLPNGAAFILVCVLRALLRRARLRSKVAVRPPRHGGMDKASPYRTTGRSWINIGSLPRSLRPYADALTRVLHGGERSYPVAESPWNLLCRLFRRTNL